jgi:hypothetical protein
MNLLFLYKILHNLIDCCSLLSQINFVLVSILLLLVVHLIPVKVDVEQSIVNAPRTTDEVFKSNLTFCFICVFNLQTDEWCVHNRLFNANFDRKFK